MLALLDIKYAFRLLFKAPKFTAMTLSVLIGGLSISLFTFSFLYSVLYKPLALPEGETAISVSVDFNGIFDLLSDYEFTQIKKNQTYLAEFGVYETKSIRLLIDDAGKNIQASFVDSGFFNFSRTLPIMGRTIQAQDLIFGANPVAVISYQTWQNELAANDNVLNMSISINDELTDIIGVMPQGYRFPGVAKIWLPLLDSMLNGEPNSEHKLYAYARLKEDVLLERAALALSNDLDNIYQQNVKTYKLTEGKKSIQLLSFPIAQTVGLSTTVFSFLNAIAWMILLLACINVGNLLFARSIERQKETAIRAALGATSARLVSQLMWEGIIITCLGGILSVLLVGAALEYTNIILHSWMPEGMMFWWHWGMDKETLGMATAFTLITILLSSFLPAWRSAHQDINTTLRDGTRGAQSKKAGRLSRLLVTTQVFLVALLMLIGAMTGFMSNKLLNIDLGDDYRNVMRASVELPKHKYSGQEEKIQIYESLLERIKNNPEVEGALGSNYAGYYALTLGGIDTNEDLDIPEVDTFSLLGDTKLIGINLVDGRHFSRHDKIGSRKVALISKSMANRYWPSESVLEKTIKLKIDEQDETLTIVGVLTNRMNPRSLFGKLDSQDEVYISSRQFVTSNQSFYYKTRMEYGKAEEIFYHALFNIDSSIKQTRAVERAEENRNIMRDIMSVTSKITFGTGFFALMLALVGIYGLTANSVAQRTHEIGIRRAVGATDKNIISMFLKQGTKQLFVGLGLALLIFSLLASAFHSFADGAFPVYLYFVLALVVAVGLSCVVMLAIYSPTKRAVIMEPSSALRYE